MKTDKDDLASVRGGDYFYKNFVCREVPVSKCKTKKFHVPTQELLHRKKCLLPDDIKLHSGSGAEDDYGSPLSNPLASYGQNRNNRLQRSRRIGR